MSSTEPQTIEEANREAFAKRRKELDDALGTAVAEENARRLDSLVSELDALGRDYHRGPDSPDNSTSVPARLPTHIAVRRAGTENETQSCASKDGLVEAVKQREAQLVALGR
jgi:hypothetical protein